jgi:peptide-methionine (S)-S-oxide reductase
MRNFMIFGSLALMITVLALLLGPMAHERAVASAIPSPKADTTARSSSEKAVLAGGCFWGIQGTFEHVKGVSKVVSGYSGGEASTATYGQVSSENTGHAESVEITYDPKEVSFGTLLKIFFSVAHDPTQIDRQGPDSGSSYRSEIFATTPEQEKIAKAYIAQLTTEKTFDTAIATRVEPLKAFYPAEDYHQGYLKAHPDQPYIVINDLPKIEALKRVYPDLYR